MVGWTSVNSFKIDMIFRVAHGFYDSFLRRPSLSHPTKQLMREMAFRCHSMPMAVNFSTKISRWVFILYVQFCILFERVCQDAGHDKVIFLIKLVFIIYTSKYIHTPSFLESFVEAFNSLLLFTHKK
jgi:hypothetical protein